MLLFRGENSTYVILNKAHVDAESVIWMNVKDNCYKRFGLNAVE